MKPSLARAAAVSATILVTAATVVGQQDPAIRLLPAPRWECLEEMHDFYTRRFESVDGFGVARMPTPPMLDRTGVLTVGQRRYAIERLELIGLLKRSTPVVYVPMRHTMRYDPADFGSRGLSDFETRALASLRTGRAIASAAGEEPRHAGSRGGAAWERFLPEVPQGSERTRSAGRVHLPPAAGRRTLAVSGARASRSTSSFAPDRE